MRLRYAPELLVSLLGIAVITAAYALAARHGLPSCSGPLGHALGIAGFLLMLAAETLYSLRKRWLRVRRGAVRRWLQTHIVAGVLGPLLVLLHTAGKLGGMAGTLTGLTMLLAVSGFVGRFAYAAVPRTIDAGGDDDDREARARRLLTARRWLALWYWFHIPLGVAVFVMAFVHIGAALYYSTFSR